MRIVVMLFFVGFAVLGSFTYSGILVKEATGQNIFIVGLILSVFGIGTVFGGKIVGFVRNILKNWFLIVTGALGLVALLVLSSFGNIAIIILGFFGYGIAFIFLQSTIIATAQENLPNRKGTAMSMASFNVFVGAAVGTTINGSLMKVVGLRTIFTYSGILLFFVGIIVAIFVSTNKIKQQKK